MTEKEREIEAAEIDGNVMSERRARFSKREQLGNRSLRVKRRKTNPPELQIECPEAGLALRFFTSLGGESNARVAPFESVFYDADYIYRETLKKSKGGLNIYDKILAEFNDTTVNVATLELIKYWITSQMNLGLDQTHMQWEIISKARSLKEKLGYSDETGCYMGFTTVEDVLTEIERGMPAHGDSKRRIMRRF